jgi:hypothetical protein
VPLAVAASMFRMAHVFLALGQRGQAQQVDASAAAAGDNKRRQAHDHLGTPRAIADQLGEDRDDFGTEFGATNIAIHTVSIAVELGDTGMPSTSARPSTPAPCHLNARPATCSTWPAPPPRTPRPR